QLRRDRAAFKEEYGIALRQIAQQRQDLEQERAAVLAVKDACEEERRRARQLCARLKRRWHRPWHAQAVSLKRRARQLATGLVRLERDAERLRQARLRLNGERELARRQIRSGRTLLKMDQEKWQAARAREQAAWERDRRAVEDRAAALAAEQEHWNK